MLVKSDETDESVVDSQTQNNEEEDNKMSKENKRTIGTKLTLLKDGSGTDLLLAKLTSIGEIGIESEEIDTTALDSEGDFKEFIAGSKDAGEVTVEGYLFDTTQFIALLELGNSREVRNWNVEYPSGATWAFSAFVKSIKDGAKEVDGVAKFSMNLRISGAPVFTATAGGA